MGSVFDAEQVSTGRRVALKVLHPHVAQDARSASRFQREARTAAALVHPGIVPVLAFGTTDGAAWLAMARVDGCSLQRLLAAVDDPRDVDHDRARALLDDPKRLARVIAETADALEFAHRRGVVHRDVKPANLMLDDEGRAVVLDFGLATACEPDAASLTRTGEFLGTPLYMAPEQAVGAENGTARSDVYALGAVLYECLCRRPPVAPGPLATVIDAILNREPLDPRRARPGVPGELARIALQCLEKEPGRRYPTAAALAADLRRFVDGSVVLARNSGLVGRTLRRLRRRPAVAVLAALLCVAVPASLAAWAFAGRADAQAAQLLRERDLARVDELLAGAPERLTVFGGASLRFYARLGLGERIDDGTSRRSPAAAQALALADALVAADPDERAGRGGGARPPRDRCVCSRARGSTSATTPRRRSARSMRCSRPTAPTPPIA
jgi:tRNA A-37 threonylcarbamoyl transferase component Bud32